MEIINEESVEFQYPDEDFVIIFEDGVWKAKSGDENVVDEIILIEDKKSSISMNEDMKLFSNFILTKSHFDKLKELVGDKG